MVTQAVKEVFTLINLLCGGLTFLGLLLYALRARPRNTLVLVILAVVVFVCLLNAISVYFLL